MCIAITFRGCWTCRKRRSGIRRRVWRLVIVWGRGLGFWAMVRLGDKVSARDFLASRPCCARKIGRTTIGTRYVSLAAYSRPSHIARTPGTWTNPSLSRIICRLTRHQHQESTIAQMTQEPESNGTQCLDCRYTHPSKRHVCHPVESSYYATSEASSTP